MPVLAPLPAAAPRPAESDPAVVPRLRGWSQLVCFVASACVGTVLVLSVSPGHRVAAAVYAVAVSALFGTSALYHRGRWQPAAARVMERLDHAMIFVLIGGTATPLFLLCLPSAVGVPVLIGFGAVVVAALAVHVVWIDAPEALVTATYVVLGCLGGIALPGVWVRAGVAAFVLVLAGGVVYIVGAVLFQGYRPDPRPDVFGYHEVWHCFVAVAAALQYVAIGLLIL